MPELVTLLDAVTLAAADDRPAVIYVETDKEPVIVSRRAFRDAATTAARALTRLGLRPGDLVVIAHTQNLESVHAFWGALLMGAVPSMFPTLTEKLDPEVYMRGMAELARLSDVAAVLTTDEFAPTLRPNMPCPVYGSSDLESLPAPDQPSPFSPRPSEIAFLQHSSGTTGLQKGVALSHTAVLNQLAAYSRAISLCENDVVVSWLPLYHDMGLIAGFLLPLTLGVPLVLMSPFDWVSRPALLLRAIHDHGGTLCWLPNFAYNHCARRIRRRDSQGWSLASMRLFINCSEPVRHDSHQLFLERFAENGARPEMLAVSYAMAENTFAVTQTSPGVPARLDVVDAAELDLNGYAKNIPADHP
ncbi:MAG: AMP-binding protein, partial [Candidatus Promineofilum sp.]|nr:AMP-binding protein [Promineifilum sp.]